MAEPDSPAATCRRACPRPASAEIGALERFVQRMAQLAPGHPCRARGLASARSSPPRDETRRRIERDLHDGTQQRLVSLGLELRLGPVDRASRPLRAQDASSSSIAHEPRRRGRRSTRDLTRHPSGYPLRGRPRARVANSRPSLRDSGRARVESESQLPEQLEVAAYYVVSETLTNATKHSRASRVLVAVADVDGTLQLSIRDDGIGGADPEQGSGSSASATASSARRVALRHQRALRLYAGLRTAPRPPLLT